jgi:hypothetical protein
LEIADGWVTPGNNETHGELNLEMMSKFRSGTYASHEESVQQAWLFFAINLVGAVNPEWKEEQCVRHQLMSEATNESDEAFAVWVLTHYRERWVYEAAEDAAHNANGTTRPRRTRPKGMSVTKKHMESFYTRKRTIVNQRKHREVATNGWEEAIKNKAALDYRNRLLMMGDDDPTWQDGGDGDEPPTELELVNAQLPDGVSWEDCHAV